MKLRNSIYNKKVKTIDRTVRKNKKILEKGEHRISKMRLIQKLKCRADAMKIRRTRQIRVTNLSSKEAERNHFVKSSRLASYGLCRE